MAIIGDPIDPQSASYAGQLVGQLPGFRAAAALRSTAGTKRLLRCTVTAPSSGETYSIRGRAPGLPWRTASFTTSTTNAADLRDGLIAAWAATDGVDFAVVSAAASGTAIDAEALAAGAQNPIEFEVVADPTSDLSAFAVIVAGADAFEATFGRYVAVSGYSEASDAARPVVGELSVLAGDSLAVTISVDTDGDTFVQQIVRNGVLVDVTYDADTDTATTVPIAVAAYEAAFPDATVTGVTGTGVITIAFPVGYGANVAFESAGGSSTISTARTAGDDVPDSAMVYDDGTAENLTIGATATGYSGRQSVAVLGSGFRVGAEKPGESITAYGTVWVETASGADKGRPFASPAPSRFAHPAHQWLASGQSVDIIGG